jgi:hypothetical protein
MREAKKHRRRTLRHVRRRQIIDLGEEAAKKQCFSNPRADS